MATSSITRRTRILTLGAATTALCVGLSSVAGAQDSTLEPTFGTITEGNGFTSVSQTIQAGGDIDASGVAPGCNGFIADAPDVIFDYSGQDVVLIQALSDADTTMVVEAPDGQLLCNDDYEGLNPGIETSFAEPGRYAIWVGTFDPIQNDTYPDADVVLSALSGGGSAPVMPSQDVAASGFNALEAPTFGEIAVAQGFGTQTFNLQAGGLIDAFEANDTCAGFIADVPDYVVALQDGAAGQLNLDVVSEVDTTLVVVSPTGEVFCNDDSVDLNPGLSLFSPVGGNYALWVGTFNPIQDDFYPDATLTVSTSAGGGGGGSTGGGSGLNQRMGLAPTFGSIQLADGFGRHALTLQAGGDQEGFNLGDTCNGFVAEAPDYVVSYNGGQALRITATSEEDTTMIVGLPNGQVLCNDDFDGLNPGVIGPEGVAGNYAVWIGTFNPIENDFFPDAELVVEEISTTKVQPSGAITSISLTAGFTPDPFITNLAAGGFIDAGTVDAECWGNIASQPDFVLNYTNGDFPLRFFVNSDADTTMLVRQPNGAVLCNDDTDGLNPAVVITDPASGSYEVFIGTFDPGAGFPEATLAISEILDEKILPEGAITETSVSLGMPRADFELLAGGSFDAFDTFGNNCNGFVASNPDFYAFVDQAGVDVEMTVRSAEDTTLVVRTPDGGLVCDDDSGGDLNPLVVLERAQAGAYEVWLGTFSSTSPAPATLSIRDINAGTTAPNQPGGGKK